MIWRRKSSGETEVENVTLDSVISEGRTVVFELLAAIEAFEKSQKDEGARSER